MPGEEPLKVACRIDERGRRSRTGLLDPFGRLAFLGPGDFTLIDSSRPARYRHSAVLHVTVTFPRALPLLAHDAVTGHDRRRGQCQHGHRGVIPALARSPVRHRSEEFQQVKAYIRDRNSHDRPADRGPVEQMTG